MMTGDFFINSVRFLLFCLFFAMIVEYCLLQCEQILAGFSVNTLTLVSSLEKWTLKLQNPQKCFRLSETFFPCANHKRNKLTQSLQTNIKCQYRTVLKRFVKIHKKLSLVIDEISAITFLRRKSTDFAQKFFDLFSFAI